MSYLKPLQQRLSYLPPEQIAQVEDAYAFAEKHHGDQKRASGELYIMHPAAVASVLATMHMDAETLQAALLHDLLEDTDITKEELSERFGPTVAELVDGVTKLTQIRFSSRAERQAESFRKTVLAMAQDLRVILIKLADRFHNAQTLPGLRPEKINRVAAETLDVYAPIAERLGMHIMATELEDLCFKAMHPWRYATLAKTVEKFRRARRKKLETVEQTLQENLARNNLEQALVFNRNKHLYSIYKNLHIRRLSLEKILRKYAFRIVVDSIDNCYRTLGVVHGTYKPIPGKFKDYIAIPKINGYQSLHTTLFGPHGVPIEIQIRTQIMEHRANYGIAAHWIYENNNPNQELPTPNKQRWLNNLLEIQQNTVSSLEFMENIKHDLFPDEVYTFTPKGKIIELPRGASVIDFAYAVHTDIGNHCVSAQIDNRPAPLAAVLHAGQTVSVITAPDASPDPSWLNFVITGRAKSGIRNFLRTQLPEQTINLGHELLENAIENLGLKLETIPKNIISELIKISKLSSIEMLYKDIGMGNRFAVLVAYQIFNLLKEHKLLDTALPDAERQFIIHGAEGSSISFATCCFPIPGDEIIGVLPPDNGLVIHTQNCTNITNGLPKSYQTLYVAWAKNIHEHFRVPLGVEFLDQRGSLGTIAQTIAEERSNIEDLQVAQKNSQHTFINFVISVYNLEHLNRIMRRISSLAMVVNVTRRHKD